MTDLQFSHCNIAMATHDTTGRTILWDRDADVFGSGYSYPQAMADLASNYGDDYQREGSEQFVPNDDLRELIDRWEDGLGFAREHQEICSAEAMNVAESHIEDLREVINDA